MLLGLQRAKARLGQAVSELEVVFAGNLGIERFPYTNPSLSRRAHVTHVDDTWVKMLGAGEGGQPCTWAYDQHIRLSSGVIYYIDYVAKLNAARGPPKPSRATGAEMKPSNSLAFPKAALGSSH